MPYLKDLQTGKYIKTADTPAVTATAVPPAGQTFRFEKNPQGGYTKIPVEAPSPTPEPAYKGGKPNPESVVGLQTLAAQAGVNIPENKPQRSTLQKILDVLNTGAYAVGGLISGKGVVEGIKQHTLPSEALGIKSGVGGFIADVLLDPTTYITFGYGGGAKLATKGGSVILNKAGTKLLKKTITEVGEEAARKALAKKVLEEGGEKFLAKGGLKFVGKQVLPRAAVTAPFKGAEKVIEKTPIVGKLYEGAKELAGKAFTPFKEIKKLPGGAGEQYVEKFSKFAKGTRAEVSKAIEETAKLGKIAKKELGPEAGEKVAQIIEKQAKKAERLPFLYHGTELENIPKIKKGGFKVGGFLAHGYPQGVYFTTTKKEAQNYGKILAVRTKLKPSELFDVSKNKALNKLQGSKYLKKLNEVIQKEAESKGISIPKPTSKQLKQYQDMIGKLKNPLDISDIKTSALQKLGYKGFVAAEKGIGKEIVIFNPKDLRVLKGIPSVKKLQQLSQNPKVNELMQTILQGQKEIVAAEKSRGLLKKEVPGYLRHFLTPEARDFLNKGGKISSELTKPLRVKTGFAKHRKIEGTLAEINKRFQKAQGINLFEPDAFKALAGRKAESVKAVRTYDFFKEVGTEFGLPAKAKTFKSPVTGKTIKAVQSTIKDGIKYVESSVPQLKGVLLPEPIVKHIDETHKFFTNEDATKGFLKVYDKVLSFWKGSVTGWFPAFHSRNFLGGTFNNWLAGVKNPVRYLQGNQIARGAEGKITTKLGTTYTYNQLRDITSKLGVTGQPGYLDVMKEVEKDMNKGIIPKFFDTPQKAMTFVENRLRLPLFVDRLVKGDTPEEAAKWVFRFHFDYAPEGLTAFEKNAMKRLIPFYRWARGNIPLQLEQMVSQPGKYAAVGKAVENLQSDKEKAKEESQYLPPYMREALPIRVGEKGGLPQYLYGLGLPVEDVNRLWRGSAKRTLAGYVGELSPILKYPIEAATGQNLFFGEPIEKNDYVYPFINKIPGLREFLEVNERKNKAGQISYRGNPYKLHFLNTMLGRLFTTAGKLTDEKTSGAVKFLYGLVGAKARPVDIEKEKFWREKEFKDRIETLLERQGVIKKFERSYIPKK